MAYWLLKSEADDLVVGPAEEGRRQGRRVDRRAQLSGAQQHAGDEDRAISASSTFPAPTRRVVGIVKVVKEAHPDSTDETGQWECVDVAAVADLPQPVTLAEIKANPKLKDMVLARVSRLSVQPVSSQEWSMICKLGGLAKPPQG